MWYLFTLIALVGNLLPVSVLANGRCIQYIQDVRTEHFRIFGIYYPYHYAVGQLEQESNCRNIVSNDGVGSLGIAQITWKVWGKYLTANGIPNLVETRNQLRAQALINKNVWGQTKPKKLWVAFQIYNGGPLVLKEITKAGVVQQNDYFSLWAAAKDQCKRKTITFSSGQKINACDINYDYSQKIFEYGDQYRIGPDSDKFKFW